LLRQATDRAERLRGFSLADNGRAVAFYRRQGFFNGLCAAFVVFGSFERTARMVMRYYYAGSFML